MSPNPQSSFIPKQTNKLSARRRRGKRFGVVNVVGTVLLLGTIFSSAGAFFYLEYTKKDLLEAKNTLNELRSKFSQSDIEKIRDLEERINVAESILSAHLSPLKVFTTLELLTQKKVAYTDFSYNKMESGDVAVTLSATTETFNTIALQSSVYKGNNIFSDSLVTDLAIVDSGEGDDVSLTSQINQSKTFVLTVAVDGNDIRYERSSQQNSIPENFSENITESTEAEVNEVIE